MLADLTKPDGYDPDFFKDWGDEDAFSLKQYATTLPRVPLPREFPPAPDPVLGVLAGTAPSRGSRARPDQPEQAASPVCGRGAHEDLRERTRAPLPCLGLGRRALSRSNSTSRSPRAASCPACTGTTRSGTRSFRSARRRGPPRAAAASSSPASPGAPAGASAARVPPHLLGCRDDAVADPCARRLSRAGRAPVHRVPRCGRLKARGR